MLIDLIFPKHCYGCHHSGSYFCPSCISALPTLSVKSSHISTLQGIVSVFPYRSIIKKSLSDLKYNFVTDQVPELSELISLRLRQNFPNLLNYWSAQKFSLVPIPLHFFRQNWRGFNQSALVCQLLSQQLGLNYLPDLLSRSRSTVTQASLSKSDRSKNVAHLFSLNPGINTLNFPNLIIFDDVITTGSTISSAAATLKLLPAGEIWALSIAGSLGNRI